MLYHFFPKFLAAYSLTALSNDSELLHKLLLVMICKLLPFKSKFRKPISIFFYLLQFHNLF